jgi:hypothetical protein
MVLFLAGKALIRVFSILVYRGLRTLLDPIVHWLGPNGRSELAFFLLGYLMANVVGYLVNWAGNLAT